MRKSDWGPPMHGSGGCRIEAALRRKMGPLTIGLLFVSLFSSAYVVLFSYVTLFKYYTFNATFLDLGLENELLWLTLHGSYFSSGFQSVYPFPYDSLATFVLLPIYGVYPHPQTLLVFQAVVLGLAAIPLYDIVHRLTSRQLISLVLVLAYLLYFPMQGANMFDFHVECIFPLAYFLGLSCWLAKRHLLMQIFFLLGALVDIVSLATVIITVLYILLQGLDLGVLHAYPRRMLRWKDLSKTLDTLPLLIGLLALLIWLWQFQPSTYAGTENYIGLGNFFVDITSKVYFLLLLAAPVAFIPLVEFEPWILIATPYLGFVFLVNADGANILPFYMQYPLLVTPILFFATARALSRVGTPELTTREHTLVAGERPSPMIMSKRTAALSFSRLPRQTKYAIFIIVASILFASVYSPFGPLNDRIEGGILQGNYGLSSLLTPTSHDQALWKVISLIPNSGSVLTQNSIPQISGRLHIEVAGYPLIPGLTPEYILGDSSLNNTISGFSGWQSILPFIVSGLSNKTYGWVAYDDGVVLLQHDYTGPLILYKAPHPTFYPPSRFSLYSGVRSPNGDLIHNASLGNASYFWYGPYANDLLPGNYTVGFSLEETGPVQHDSTLITLEVTADSGGAILSERTLTTGDLIPGLQTLVQVSFNSSVSLSQVEFRGVSVTGAATLVFSGAYLEYSP